jgi:hypothetical protein
MMTSPRLARAGLALLAMGGLAAIFTTRAVGQTPGAALVAPRIQASLREIPSPAALDSAQPHLAVSGAGRVFATWLERVAPAGSARRFRFAPFDAGRWSAAGTIAEGDRFFANWADVPSIAVLRDGTLAAHWLQMSGPGRTAYDVRVSQSRDGGRSWTAAVSPHRDGTQTEHGFASFFERQDGGLGLVWLDGRDFAQHGGGGEHGKGEMSLRAGLFDGAAPRPDVLVDGRTCDCCPTAVTPIAGGALVAYRDRSAEEIRDIVVTRFDGARWSPPSRVHADDWQIPGCPVNGPALAGDGRQQVAIAWFTAPRSQARVSVAFSRDAGASFGPPVQVSGAVPLGRVSVVWLPDGSALVGWIEQQGDTADFRVRQVGPEGARGQAVRIAALSASRASGHPRMARSQDTLVFAWTDAAEPPRVRTAIARIAP